MRGLLSTTTKRAWRTAFACALASCGLARADDPAPTTVPASATANAAPDVPDLSAMYRDAYTNPAVMGPPPGAAHEGEPGPADQPRLGIWTNPKRWKYYGGTDYIRWERTGVTHLALTSVSRDLFWDDPIQRTLGALNAEGQPDRVSGFNPPIALFPFKFFPGRQLPLEQFSPNDPEMRTNVNEFLVPGAERLTTDALDVGRPRSGFRPKIGVEFENGNRFDVSYFTIEDVKPAAIVDNVAGAGFVTKQISAARENPFPTPQDRPIPGGGGTRFGIFRFGYLDAPFTVTQGTLSVPLFDAFRGEDMRTNGGNSLFPHFPLNELPQPTVGPGPNTGYNPPNPWLPIFSTQNNFPIADPNGMRSTDIPREPTSNDFPGQSFLFRDGEVAVATFRSDIQGADAVYRHKLKEWTRSWFDLDFLVGLKWIRTNERFTFFFADLFGFSRTTVQGTPFPNGGVTLTPNVPQPPFFVPNDLATDPVDQRGQAAEDTQITIDRKITNNIFGPQIGVDFRVPFRSVLEWQVASKAGFMFNGASTSALTTRGDGLIFSDYTKSNLLTSGVWDGQLGLNFYPHPNIKINAGYEWLYIINYAGAISNQATDLSLENRPRNHDSVLYSGWYVGGEIKF